MGEFKRIVCFLALVLLYVNLYAQEYLNNPGAGFISFDVNIKNKIAYTKQPFNMATDFSYVYLSDILDDDCITNKGRIDKGKLYVKIKTYFDQLLKFKRNRRYNLRIFPEQNGHTPCKNSKVISSVKTNDGKLLLFCPPKLYKKLERTKYPPFIINSINENYKPTRNIGLLNLRSPLVQNVYNDVLETFSRYLEEKVKAPNLYSSTTARDSCRKGDFIARIEMGYVGPWGEGMTKHYGENADAESLIKIAEMYKKYFKSYILVAPSFGMRTGTTTNKDLHAFEYYLLTTKYGTLRNTNGKLTGNKEFGLFIDHLGSYDKGDFSLSYDGHNFLPIALQKYRKAPMIGENNGHLFADSLMLKDIRRWGISLCNVWVISKEKTFSDSTLNRWREATLYLGYRFYFNSMSATSTDNALHVYFHLGNRSYSPLYDDFWLPQIVIRDSKDSLLQVIDADKFINLKSIPCLKDSFKYEVMVNKTIPLKTALPKGAKVYFRVIDKCHINENMFFDNEGRTKYGEYLLTSKFGLKTDQNNLDVKIVASCMRMKIHSSLVALKYMR